MRRFKTAASLTVLCAAIGAGLGGCAMDLTPRPQYPVPQRPIEPSAAPVAAPAPAPAPAPAVVAPPPPDDGAPKAAPSTPVQSQSLPPPPGAKTAPPRRGSALEPRYQGAVEVLMFASDTQDTVTVAKGDNLAKVAKRAGVSIEDLAKANKIEPPYKVKIGQKLTMPGAEPEPPIRGARGKARLETKAEAKAEPKAAETVTVGKGDTLDKIARANGMSIEALAKANGIEAPYRLKAGQKLVLSAEAEPASSSASTRGESRAESRAENRRASSKVETVKVANGQTLQAIAKEAGVSITELARLNGLKRPYRVRAGQTIKLPSGDDQVEALARSSAPAVAPTRSVKVGKGQTLQSIADRAGVSVTELARLNKLKKPYRVKRGQTIKLPGRPVSEERAASAASSYTVKRGDTLFSIARRFDTDARSLAEANGLSPNARLNAGRRLQLPGGPLDRPEPTRGRTPSAPIPFSSLPSSNPPALTPPPTTFAPPGQSAPGPAQPGFRATPAPQPAPAPEASTDDASVAAAGKGFFQWPARGRVVSPYGPTSGSQRNDGLDIGAPAGELVRAAAGGEVVYAGNSVPGFGNLVLIRHDGGWVTAYAHLANIDVKMRQMVTQGQQIGEVGMTGGVDQTQVHFEVRYAPSLKDKARPIDPMLVLPPQ